MHTTQHVFLQAAPNQPSEIGGDVGSNLRERPRRIAQNGGRELDGRRAVERPLAARHLIENDAERKDVRPVIHRPARDLRGRHVGGRAQHDADLGASAAGHRGIRWVGRPELFCQAEVEHFHTAIVRHHDVAWLEIAVHDAFVMRRCERIRQRRADRERPIDGQAIMWNELGQRLPVDELHRRKVNAVDLVDGVDRDDMRMIQRRYGARLALEPRQAIGVASHRREGAPSARRRGRVWYRSRETARPFRLCPARRGSGSDLSTCQSQPDPRLGYGETHRSSRRRDYREPRRSTGADGARDVGSEPGCGRSSRTHLVQAEANIAAAARQFHGDCGSRDCHA